MTLWKGRLPDTAPEVRLLCDSYESDRRLYAADIRGSIAYARALGWAGVLTPEEVKALVRGLEWVLAEFKAGAFVAGPDDEDVHTAVERRLAELVGRGGRGCSTPGAPATTRWPPTSSSGSWGKSP